MPFRDTAQHLRDIIENIDLITSFVQGLSLNDYAADRRTAAAVERHLQIVTEAAYRLGDDAEAVCPGPDWRRYRGLGNLLRHAYQRIQDELIWETVNDDLPSLRQAAKDALRGLDKNTPS